MNRRHSVWTPAISATVAAVCIGVLGFILVRHLAAAGSQPPSQSAQSQPSVDVVHPRRANLSHKLTANATLEAYDQTDLYAKVSGYLTEVNVDIGDHVKEGRLLAVIALPETQKELAEAKAQLQAKQKQLKAAEAGVVQAQKLLETAQRQLDHYKADLSLQQITLKRQEELFQGKAATNQTVDDIRAKEEIAKADVGVAEAKIAGAQADVSGAEANRDFAAAQVDVAAAAVERIQTLLEYTRIIAPYPGVVTRRLVNKGDLVQAATASRTMPMFTVQRIDTIRVFCDIPENDVRHVRLGDPANIKPFGFDGKGFDGTVTRFAFWLNPETRNMRTEIDLPNSDERLYPGMYAEVSLDTDRRQNVLTVPMSAVASDSKGEFVYTIQDGRVARVPVKVGLIDGSRIEIQDGVTEDAQVVSTAKGAPPPGTAVHGTAQP